MRLMMLSHAVTIQKNRLTAGYYFMYKAVTQKNIKTSFEYQRKHRSVKKYRKNITRRNKEKYRLTASYMV